MLERRYNYKCHDYDDVCVCMFICVYACMSVCICVRVCVYACMRVRVCASRCVYVCTLV